MKKTQALIYGLILSVLYVGTLLLAHFEVVIPLQYILLFVLPFLGSVYAYQNKYYYPLAFLVGALVVSLIIDWGFGLLYILPMVVVPFVYTFLAKKKTSGNNIIYGVITAAFGSLAIANAIYSLINGVSYLDGFSKMTYLDRANNEYLAMSIIMAFYFFQALLMHFILRSYLKVDYKKNQRPDFWLLALSIASIIATPIPYRSDAYTAFTFVAAIVYCLPIVVYGYQICEKIIVLLIVQLVFFLGGSLPLLLKVLEGTQSLVAYLIIFVPVIFYGYYRLLMQEYVKK